MRSTFKGQMKQESFFLQIKQFCTITLLMHFGFSLKVEATPDGKLSSDLTWRQNNLKPHANSDNVLQLPQLEEDTCVKEISWEKIGAKAAMDLGLVKVPKGAGRSAFGHPLPSAYSNVQIKEGGAQCLSEGWTPIPRENAFGFLHVSSCFLWLSRTASTA